jgi:hypothetical protein
MALLSIQIKLSIDLWATLHGKYCWHMALLSIQIKLCCYDFLKRVMENIEEMEE